VVSSNSDPNKSSEDPSEGGVGRTSLLPEKVDYVAIAKATAIALVVAFASGAFAGFFFFWFIPVDVADNVDTIEIPFVIGGLMILLVLLTFVIGGYLAAVFAGRDFFFHGAVTGVVLLAINGASYLLPSDVEFTWVHGITLILVVPLAAVGGVIRTWQR